MSFMRASDIMNNFRKGSSLFINNRGMVFYSFIDRPDAVFRLSLVISVMLHITVFMLFFLLSRAPCAENMEQLQLESVKGEIQLINFQAGNFNLNSDVPFKDRAEKNYDADALSSGAADKPGNSGNLDDTAGSVTNTDGVVKKTYESEVLRRIHRMKYYPAYAKRMGFEGIVRLKFTLYKNGMLCGSPQVIKACTNDMLNKAGVTTIIDAAPFPPFPADIADTVESKTFFVTIDYNIRRF